MPSEKIFFIGLMSGTSLDGVDAALVEFSQNRPQLVATANTPIPPALKQDILDLCLPGDNEVSRMGAADHQLAHLFADAVITLLNEACVLPSQICAIGSHGQTIRHEPAQPTPFTLQIGNPNIIAQRTGITTIADFRRRDMAAGGQGAPLAPAFHNAQFRSWIEDRAILNIGGMANLTLLPAEESNPAYGFDTGPGNVLIDHWCQLHQGQAFDRNGEWARSGQVIPRLLQQMLTTPYFQLPPPKSTGRELFNANWLSSQLSRFSEQVSTKNIAATLTELTALSISRELASHFGSCSEVFVCGGGAHNTLLMERISALNPDRRIRSTEALDVPPDWVEAIAFAWLAKQTLDKNAGNLPTVTGACEPCILGGIYYA